MSINHPKWTGLSSLPNGKMLICPAEFVRGREARRGWSRRAPRWDPAASSAGAAVPVPAGKKERKEGNKRFHTQALDFVPVLKITPPCEELACTFSKAPVLILTLGTFSEPPEAHRRGAGRAGQCQGAQHGRASGAPCAGGVGDTVPGPTGSTRFSSPTGSSRRTSRPAFRIQSTPKQLGTRGKGGGGGAGSHGHGQLQQGQLGTTPALSSLGSF